MLRRNRISVKEEYHRRIVYPGPQYCIERIVAAPQVVIQILLFDRMRSLICDLVSFLANENLCDVALLREFDAFLVGKLGKAPEGTASTGRTSGMKAIGPALLLAVFHGQIRLTAERLNSLLDDGLRLIGVLQS